MAVNETIAAFVRGGRAPGAAGGVGTVRSWSTETEFLLPGGRRKVRPDGVGQAPEIGVPVLMVEVDRSTMAPADVAAKFPPYRELFRTRVRDNDPALADRESAERAVHCWRGRWRREVRDYNDDGWRECDDAVPVVATTLELLAGHGLLGPVWWRFGRSGRHSLIEALENPNNRAAYDQYPCRVHETHPSPPRSSGRQSSPLRIRQIEERTRFTPTSLRPRLLRFD
ncbi:replication-relaxation family protein [Kitasatospora sp. NPDC059747]|uniref:replication-relaxation family protein n=1 Tax=Kitasatospora sp. NPDC059747 TaxID=3346930 RepID=UPI0036622B74